jgi:hypothetical protein
MDKERHRVATLSPLDGVTCRPRVYCSRQGATSALILGYNGYLTPLFQISACENILVDSQVKKHSPKKRTELGKEDSKGLEMKRTRIHPSSCQCIIVPMSTRMSIS